MANPGEEQSFSWWRAAKHVGLVLLVGLIAAGVSVAFTDVGDPEQMGEETGRLLAPALVVALFTSWLIQRRKTLYAWVFGALTLLIIAGAVATPILKRTRSHAVALHGSDTAPLELVDIGGEKHFRHPYLGFSFARPSPSFAPDPGAQSAAGALLASDSTHVYALSEGQTSDDLLLVVLSKSNRVTRDELEGFVAGISRIKDSYADPREVERHVSWEPSFRGAHLHYVIAELHHLRVYAHVDDFDTGDDYIVALVGLSMGHDRLAPALDSFRP